MVRCTYHTTATPFDPTSTSTSSVDQSVNRHQQSSARFDSEQIVTPSVCHGKSGSWMTVSSFSVGSSFRSLPGLPPSTALDLSHIQASCNRKPSILMTDLLSATYQSGQLLVNRVGITGIAAGMPCHGDEDGCLPSIQLAASLLAGSRIVDADVVTQWGAFASSRPFDLLGIRRI